MFVCTDPVSQGICAPTNIKTSLEHRGSSTQFTLLRCWNSKGNCRVTTQLISSSLHEDLTFLSLLQRPTQSVNMAAWYIMFTTEMRFVLRIMLNKWVFIDDYCESKKRVLQLVMENVSALVKVVKRLLNTLNMICEDTTINSEWCVLKTNRQ